jgi:hypothetical protein
VGARGVDHRRLREMPCSLASASIIVLTRLVASSPRSAPPFIRSRLARGRLFDDVGAVILRAVNHDAVLARHNPSLSRSARRLRCSSLRSNCVTAAVSWRVSLLRSRAHYLGTVEAGGFPLWMAAFNAKDALAMQTRWLHFLPRLGRAHSRGRTVRR